MPIDSSIYSNIQQFKAPDLMEAQTKASSLGLLDLQKAKALKEMGAKDYEQQAKALDFHINQAGAIAQLAMSAKDQPSYEAALAQGKKMGLDTSTLPEQFDPNMIKTVAANAFKQSDRLAAMKQQYELPNIQSQTAKNYSEIDKNRAETAKTQGETIKRPIDMIGGTDPAKMVPMYVPKEHQAAAFKEISAAEDTNNMAQSIMDSFDQAVNDTRGLGRLTSLVKTPRSAEALHQAMQPTFKDLEGTVRQAAMDNTFKNITPNGADTDADIAIKRDALKNYLQSKSSAPTARGYGIDLAKFKSTAPYSPADKKDSGGMDNPLVSSANAGTSTGSPSVPPGFILMKAPKTGKIALVRESDKAEAIASGGSVVK